MTNPTINDTLQRIAVQASILPPWAISEADAALLLLREAATHAEAIIAQCEKWFTHQKDVDPFLLHASAILALLGATSNGDDHD